MLRPADTPGMEFDVALRYPNGRTYNTVLDRDHALERTTEFDMYGHTWRAIGLLDSTPRGKFGRRAEVVP